jgi:hypothetical protein
MRHGTLGMQSADFDLHQTFEQPHFTVMAVPCFALHENSTEDVEPADSDHQLPRTS